MKLSSFRFTLINPVYVYICVCIESRREKNPTDSKKRKIDLVYISLYCM